MRRRLVIQGVSDVGQNAIPGLSVIVTPSQDRAAIVRFSADAGVYDTAGLRIAYSVDGGPAAEYRYGRVVETETM